MSKVLIIAGRTGGPILPLLAIYHNLENVKGLMVGVRGGYEEKLATQKNLPLICLPEVKLRPWPKKRSLWKICLYFLETFGTLIVLIYSISRSLILLLKQKPRVILSAGSFLAVPIIYAAKLANWFLFQKIRIVVHQQDPLPGLSNRLTVSLADLKTYVFDYTRDSFSQFSQTKKIPNPLNLQDWQSESMMQAALEISETKPFLHNFFRSLSSEKPLLLIFGGASGAQAINDWVIENLIMLKSRFNVLHLTGSLQKKEYELAETEGYISIESLTEKEMKLAQNVCDLVLCRAGMGSITELLYLQKPAYLVPIPNSHQELNAELVGDFFYVLRQDERSTWLSKLFTTYPHFFEDVEYPNNTQTEAELESYYQAIQSFLNP